MKGLKTVAILQSRMTSTRLPGKALADISGKSLTGWIIERAKRCRRFDDVVLACPDEKEDDPLAAAFGKQCRVFRGSLHDVLARYWGAAMASGAEVVVRVVGDNPLLDPAVMDEAVSAFQSSGYEYGTTPNCPLGIGAEVFTMQALDRAYRESTEKYQREHVTPYFYEAAGRFRTGPLDVSSRLFGLGKDSVRLTVDTEDDLAIVREIYQRLLPKNPEFGLKEISELFHAEPGLFQGNRHIRQKSFREAE